MRLTTEHEGVGGFKDGREDRLYRQMVSARMWELEEVGAFSSDACE